MGAAFAHTRPKTTTRIGFGELFGAKEKGQCTVPQAHENDGEIERIKL